MADTPNHGYNVPSEGTTDWHIPLNQNFESFDTDIEIRDTADARATYQPTAGAKFLATDTGFVWIGDGRSWTPQLALGRLMTVSNGAPSLLFGEDTNKLTVPVGGATISGGASNTVGAEWGTVSGGLRNAATRRATVGGGQANRAIGARGTVAGGIDNRATGTGATVGGGNANRATKPLATVSGGIANFAQATESVIGGGNGSYVNGEGGTVAGGIANSAARHAAVGGGTNNSASGETATVPGGQNATASGESSFAAGRAAAAKATGAFVWGDSTSTEVESTTQDEVVFQAGGGVTLWSNSKFQSGVQLPSGGGSWSASSSRAAKSGVRPVTPESVLAGVRELDVSRWEYDSQRGVTHMGPMAESFYEAFELGDSPERITGIDADGVALAAIQALANRIDPLVDERDKRIDQLETKLDRRGERIDQLETELDRRDERIDDLEAELDAHDDRIERLEATVASMADEIEFPGE